MGALLVLIGMVMLSYFTHYDVKTVGDWWMLFCGIAFVLSGIGVGLDD